ncbi:DUF5686 and carboxypeptidase-like regulatory domain-containing protein [Nonlabens xiamenensis]|uniref:DUF5686 and carboxypeptidase-like regulatory domain-containing protein n=1 Tax=Nonlabens xiamenensis TaxID=2341043 RepID=UPI001F0C1DBB|nr:DUF5686 and carboxypeptidase-like regulatory domain-containing protein [Nonlabens xiamenensis]
MYIMHFLAFAKAKSSHISILLFCLISFGLQAQTKVGGVIYDEFGDTVPFANVVFPGSSEGTISNDDGRFYLQSDQTFENIEVSFVGYKTQLVPLEGRVQLDLVIKLSTDTAELDAVVVYSGKTSKKNNPAIDILRKVWANRRKNGLSQFNQYQYDKYEKLEFDMNTIDSAMINSKLFKGMEFIFDYADTSKVTGKTYLPIFINESLSTVYGDNQLNKEKEDVKANKNSGFSQNQTIIAFVKDLYNDIDVYDRYLKFFDKSFTSPVGKSGIDTYNYVLRDTAMVDGVEAYNIVYYPRRKNELTFKGDFWVAADSYAIKEINMQATKSANINWVKEIYIEQEYDVLNDSLFLITRDYFLSDFALNKKEKSKGIYGKRTTLFDDYRFDEQKPEDFYRRRVNDYDPEIYNRDEAYWDEHRLEKLNKDEKQVYTMLDTLKENKKFKRLYNLGTILASGYYEIDNFDIGPVFSVFGFNEVEGLRLRGGGRTYFGANDPWRLEGYLAYGFRDDKVKYGISGKWLLDKKSRLTLYGGNRRDVEQLAASLTNTNDVLGRSLASSALITAGNNGRLSSINLSTFGLSFEPLYNLEFRIGASHRTIKTANPGVFSLDYRIPGTSIVTGEVSQTDVSLTTTYTPGRKTSNYGVDRTIINDGDYPILYVNYTRGIEDFLDSDFNYNRAQFYYSHPFQIGAFGQLTARVEAGKTFGQVPLALLDVIPGNQTYFNLAGAFNTMNFYEFVTDQYTTLHLNHNFNGRLFSRVPWLRDLNLRELVGLRAVYGTISDENIAINRSNLEYRAPEDIYWEYSAGIGNIFKILRIDVSFRGSYNYLPDARSIAVTGSFGFSF